MNGLSQENTIVGLRAQTRRQAEALEQIVERCEAVNYPPDLVVDIAALARQGLGRATPPRSATRLPQQGEAHA